MELDGSLNDGQGGKGGSGEVRDIMQHFQLHTEAAASVAS